MPTFSGDVPITTFFSYKSSAAGKKRKIKPQPTASSSFKTQKRAKQKTGSTEETSFTRESLSDHSSNLYAHPNDGDKMNSSNIKFLKKRKTVVSLQTPPTTIEKSSRRRNILAQETASNSCTSLPTPITLSRSQPRQLQSPVLNMNDTPCKPTHNFIPTPSPSNFSHNGTLFDDSDLPDSPKSYRCIPSSQSQDGAESFYQPPAIPVSLTPQLRFKASPILSIPLNADPRTSTTPQRKTRSLRFPSVAAYDQMILSSQSQLLDPFDTSPRRERSATNATNANSNVEISVERIPSSQAHEKELMAATKDLSKGYLRGQDTYQHGSSSSTFPNRHMPPRTLSDELFSIPIRRNVLSGIFTKKESSNSLSHNEDSVTESETESETDSEGEHTSARSVNGLTISKASKQAIHFPLSGNLTHHGRSSQQHSQSDLGISSASLPHPLVDFHDMFESNDESYPPDFPTSLRI